MYVDLPPMGRANDAVGALGAILDAVGNGRIAPSEASAFATLVEAFVRIKNVAELELRLENVENGLKENVLALEKLKR